MSWTWNELKAFCNALPESELDHKVILWRESEAITDISAMQLEEDHYIDLQNDEDGCFPESIMHGFIRDEDAYPEGIDGFKKVYGMGFPLLTENF